MDKCPSSGLSFCHTLDNNQNFGCLFGHILDKSPKFGHFLAKCWTSVQILDTFWSYFGHLPHVRTQFGHSLDTSCPKCVRTHIVQEHLCFFSLGDRSLDYKTLLFSIKEGRFTCVLCVVQSWIPLVNWADEMGSKHRTVLAIGPIFQAHTLWT